MPSINPRVLDDLRALQTPGAPSFLGELIDLFLQEADGHLQKLRDSFAAKDAALFERSAHTLKGSSGNLGAQAMSRICADLQHIGHAADWTRAAGVLPALQTEYLAVKGELLAERKKL
ncbi:MAG TPA: Hpt domain-containing protein [Planctomycetota bacterium]|nr:Hpt domain-containing protein [Planctomycetota bacterium]